MAASFDTPQEYLYQRERQSPDLPYLHQPVAGGYRHYTWGECVDHARRLAAALRGMGLAPGDRVAIFSRNCAEWFIADFALMIGGYVSVPIYSSAGEDTTRHILSDSGSKAVFLGKLDHPALQERGIGEAIIRIAMPWDTLPCAHEWQQLIENNEPLAEDFVPQVSDVMTLLYTSGSTGSPKGAVHVYRSFVYAGTHIGRTLQVSAADRILSYLPLAHCTERAYVEASTLVHGGQVWFVGSPDTFVQNLRDCRPTFFGSVPRLWKIFQLQVLEKIPAKRLDVLLAIPLVGGLLKRKIKRGMGLDQARWFMSGSAPIATALLEWWERLGVPIAEGWGMTETLAYGTLLPFGDEIRRGTIGKACAGTELRIAPSGELEIRTETLMLGYYNDDAKTAESFTEDGFFRTGDRAEIDADGYVKITGRVKDIFKTAKGKYVAPAPIESVIARNEIVELVCLIGSGLTQPVALLRLSAASASLGRDALLSSLEDTRQRVNTELEKHERIAHFIVVGEAWSPENGLLTPTLKIRRHAVETRYRGLVETSHPAPVVFASV